MKWALAQLYRYNDKPFKFSTEYDFTNMITNIDDILDLKIVKVEGVGQRLYDNRYRFQLHIETQMVLEDAVTLEPVDFPIDLQVTELFDTIDDGEANLIEGTTIDLEPIVWEIIYLEKPMRITKHID